MVVFSLIVHVVHYVQSVRTGEDSRVFRCLDPLELSVLITFVILYCDDHLPVESLEYTNLVQDPDDMDQAELKAVKSVEEEAIPIHVRRAQIIRIDVDMDGDPQERSICPPSRQSTLLFPLGCF